MNRVFLHIIAGIISLALILKFYHLTPQTYIFPYFAAPMRPFHEYDTYRYTSIILWFISLFIILILWYRAKSFKDISKSIKSWLVAIIISILFYGSFYIVQAKYTYEEHPSVFGYFSDDGQYIVDKEKYFNLVKKYWFSETSYKPFKTLEDSIEALEYANINNFKWLYKAVFYDLEKFWYDKAFEKYHDKTFQVYFIKRFIEDYAADDIFFYNKYSSSLNLYSDLSSDLNIKKIINNLYTEVNNNESNKDFLRDLYHKYIEKIKELKGVNWNIFYY